MVAAIGHCTPNTVLNSQHRVMLTWAVLGLCHGRQCVHADLTPCGEGLHNEVVSDECPGRLRRVCWDVAAMSHMGAMLDAVDKSRPLALDRSSAAIGRLWYAARSRSGMRVCTVAGCCDKLEACGLLVIRHISSGKYCPWCLAPSQ
jgi:hypothetical protein